MEFANSNNNKTLLPWYLHWEGFLALYHVWPPSPFSEQGFSHLWDVLEHSTIYKLISIVWGMHEIEFYTSGHHLMVADFFFF